MYIIPYVTIVWVIILALFEFFIQRRYKNRDLIKSTFCYLDNYNITIHNFYKIFTSLLTHTKFVGHFIPNILITCIFGTLLERLIGNIKMLIYTAGCLFIYWPIIYIFRIKGKSGCGFSAIFYSFFSIYFTVLAINEKDKNIKILYLILPFIILIFIHLLGRVRSTSTEFIHVLSLLYGYMIGLYEYSQSDL
jgi:membrane associated rhomboid family serine protease